MTTRTAVRWGLLLAGILAISGCRRAPGTAEISLFFVRTEPSAFSLAEVHRTVPRGGAEDLARAALEALLAGPSPEEQAQGLHSTIPRGTRLRSVRIRDGVVWADFTAEVTSGGGSASAQGRFWQIVYTATQFPGVPRVQFLVEGQVRQVLTGEGVIIDEPIGRRETPPRF
jgi:spore germination protein GerM